MRAAASIDRPATVGGPHADEKNSMTGEIDSFDDRTRRTAILAGVSAGSGNGTVATRWIEANGVQLRYELTAGRAGAIVLVHEMGGALESWDDVVLPLSARASVLRYDQRGAGLSEKIPGDLAIDVPAADLARLLDALDIARPIAVVGCAVGAAVAAAFAARYPDRLDALALLAPSTYLDAAKRSSTLERIDAIERLGIRAALGDSEPRTRYETIRLASDPKSFAATWRMLVDLEMTAELAAIRCPTLVAAGQRDSARPPAHVRSVAEQIPRARFVMLDTGHVMAIETPALVVSTLARFLDDCRF
jgi:3-oxoadipate enol-lactonase